MSNTSKIAGIGIAVLMLFATTARAAKPLALHPDNPHYFVWHGKPTILITSGEHYGAVLNLDFDYVRYLQTLQADGLNLTRTFSGVYREAAGSFQITDNTLAPKPGRYICPWARSDQPGYRGGGNKFDLNRWNPAYFERLRDFMTHAQRCGVVVEMNLFCPMYRDRMWNFCPMNAANNVNGIGTCPRKEVYTLKHPDLLKIQLAVTRKIVRELREFDNLYFEVCNEPYFGGVTMPWQRRIVDEIVKTEQDMESPHLISLNIANGRKKIENPPPAVSIFNFHYCYPPDVVAMNYQLNKAIGENETGFRGKADLLYRTEGWDFLIAGGGLYNNLDYSFTARYPDGTFRDYKSPGGGSPELRHQLSILKRFLYGFDFTAMKPDNRVIRHVSNRMQARALVQPGKAYAIYVHVPVHNKPKPGQYSEATTATLAVELPAGRYQAQWINTKTGKVERSNVFEHGGGAKKLETPEFVVDIALRLIRK